MKLNYSNFSSNLNRILVSNTSINSNKKIAIAVSGGADSMCLTSLLNQYCNEKNYELHAVTIDHDLRPGSYKEALDTKEFLERQCIKTFLLKWKKNSAIKSNIHQHARNARYKLLLEFCKQNEIKILCTAHNYHDQAETVLMRIMRGSGVDGIAAIPQSKKLEEILIIRPLLPFKRNEVEEYLKNINWNWVNDPSNFNDRFERTKIRLLMNNFEDTEILQKRLILLANNATRTKKFLENHTDKIFRTVCTVSQFGFVTLEYEEFVKLDEEIALRILVKIFNYVGGIMYTPRLNSLLLLLQQLKKKNSFKGQTLARCEIIKKENILIILRERKYIQNKQNLQKDIWQIWDHRFEIRIALDDYFVTCLSEKIWQDIKPENFIHKLPIHKILYTTPIIISNDKKIKIHPLFNLSNNNQNSLPNFEIRTNYKG